MKLFNCMDDIFSKFNLLRVQNSNYIIRYQPNISVLQLPICKSIYQSAIIYNHCVPQNEKIVRQIVTEIVS